ncbi:hypothetical protein [Thermodesulfatator autotrophicus]|uniref:DUF8082 domain-containing protein n=1 Tax=Thermodesulfatator autotrophicus TaxID=1795632 RepID=A0A177E931_9BACT|nr:hypothetical protein [Thermodesulfatator autotrophicus]OAG28001.1 hypothetical protein TH606_03975 [Thermodesulfatator autotrophicus]
MAFAGKAKDIEEIFDILQIIENQNKEGNLIINNDKENFIIKVKKGHIHEINTNANYLSKLKDKEKIPETWKSYFHYINSAWNNFYFNFKEKKIKENKQCIPISHFLLNFSTERDEISHIIKKLINNNINFSIKGELKEENFNTLDLWVYGQIIKGTNIEEIIFGNIPLKGILKSINKLFKAGLIEAKISEETKEEENRLVEKEKIEEFEEFLAKIIGPVAELLIIETLDELNIEKEKFSYSETSLFIESIAQKIPEDCIFEGYLCKEIVKNKFFEIIEATGRE